MQIFHIIAPALAILMTDDKKERRTRRTFPSIDSEEEASDVDIYPWSDLAKLWTGPKSVVATPPDGVDELLWDAIRRSGEATPMFQPFDVYGNKRQLSEKIKLLENYLEEAGWDGNVHVTPEIREDVLLPVIEAYETDSFLKNCKLKVFTDIAGFVRYAEEAGMTSKTALQFLHLANGDIREAMDIISLGRDLRRSTSKHANPHNGPHSPFISPKNKKGANTGLGFRF